jgi:hypothetical protein
MTPVLRAPSVLLAAIALGCSPAAAGITGDAGAAACGACHTGEYAEWSGSRLATSGMSPVFLGLAASATAAWGEQAGARCVACHEPGFGGDHGIGCVACHSATGNLAERDGLLTVDTDAPISGPFDDPTSTPAHGSRADALLVSPALCGTCHEVTGPGLLHETTKTEYEASSAGAAGAGCISCHMLAEEPGPVARGETRSRPRADHSFIGVDPPWGASPQVARAAALSTVQLLRFGLALQAVRAGDGFDVTLTNRAGHAVPTGAAFLRSIWVDVELAGADGAVAGVPSVIELGSQPTRDGEPVALITQADAVQSNELLPGASRTAHITAPLTLMEPVRAVATLRMRAIRPDVLGALGLANRSAEVPTHEVVVVRAP